MLNSGTESPIYTNSGAQSRNSSTLDVSEKLHLDIFILIYGSEVYSGEFLLLISFKEYSSN